MKGSEDDDDDNNDDDYASYGDASNENSGEDDGNAIDKDKSDTGDAIFNDAQDWRDAPATITPHAVLPFTDIADQKISPVGNGRSPGLGCFEAYSAFSHGCSPIKNAALHQRPSQEVGQITLTAGNGWGAGLLLAPSNAVVRAKAVRLGLVSATAPKGLRGLTRRSTRCPSVCVEGVGSCGFFSPRVGCSVFFVLPCAPYLTAGRGAAAGFDRITRVVSGAVLVSVRVALWGLLSITQPPPVPGHFGRAFSRSSIPHFIARCCTPTEPSLPITCLLTHNAHGRVELIISSGDMRFFLLCAT